MFGVVLVLFRLSVGSAAYYVWSLTNGFPGQGVLHVRKWRLFFSDVGPWILGKFLLLWLGSMVGHCVDWPYVLELSQFAFRSRMILAFLFKRHGVFRLFICIFVFNWTGYWTSSVIFYAIVAWLCQLGGRVFKLRWPWSLTCNGWGVRRVVNSLNASAEWGLGSFWYIVLYCVVSS